MQLGLLTEEPAGFADANAILTAVDSALAIGFSRLTEDLRGGLEQIADAFAPTPLGPALRDGLERLSRSEFPAQAFVALAAARGALTGAMHDALADQAQAALGYILSQQPEPLAAPAGEYANLLAACQQWLGELAVTGFRNVEEAQLGPFSATLERLQTASGEASDGLSPALAGLAALLTGFADELAREAQKIERENLFARRFGDLWAHAMIVAQNPLQPPPFATIDGVLHPCGVDRRGHHAFVNATLYGLLVADDAPETARMVRLSFASWKVSVLTGEDEWRLFGAISERVLEALQTGASLRLEGAELAANGDLRLTRAPDLGEPAAPLDLPQPWRGFAAIPAARRHPIHFMQLVRLDEVSVSGGEVGSGSVRLALAEGRGDAFDWDEKALSQARDMIGLLRYDAGRFALQPLLIDIKGKGHIRAGQSLKARLSKSKNDALDILKERASRLLRQ